MSDNMSTRDGSDAFQALCRMENTIARLTGQRDRLQLSHPGMNPAVACIAPGCGAAAVAEANPFDDKWCPKHWREEVRDLAAQRDRLQAEARAEVEAHEKTKAELAEKAELVLRWRKNTDDQREETTKQRLRAEAAEARIRDLETAVKAHEACEAKDDGKRYELVFNHRPYWDNERPVHLTKSTAEEVARAWNKAYGDVKPNVADPLRVRLVGPHVVTVTPQTIPCDTAAEAEQLRGHLGAHGVASTVSEVRG